jgi:signal transduction histidine kinase
VEVGRDGDRAVVSVTDGCGGIPEADLPHVFETGWQKDPARSQHGRWTAPDGGPDDSVPDGGAPGDGFRVPGPDEPAGVMRYSGAGLGLSIVAGIVSAHQGTVTVENVDGGCRFSLRLPGQEAAGQEPVAGGATAPAASAQGSHNRIPRDAVEEKLRTGRAQ